MNNSRYHPLSASIRLLLMAMVVLALALGTGQTARAGAGPALVNLGTAAPFAILTKAGITNVPTSAITGNLGVSPIASTAITGFSLVADPTNTFSRSSQVTGKIYAANYAAPTPANLTTAVHNMETAYNDAAGRALPDFTEIYGGNLSGKTLVPGLYKWSTGVLVTTTVTLAGAADAVWIFQIAGNLTMGSGAKVMLSGGAQANNIFWQVGGGVGVEIGTTAHVEGTLLAKKAIHLRTGASLNGRALAQTAVTLEKNEIVLPLSRNSDVFTSDPLLDGWILESSESSGVGGSLNASGATFRVGDDALDRQYLSILSFDTSSLPDNAVITEATLRIRKFSVTGTDPFTTHGNILVDMRKNAFSSNRTLQIIDFNAPASHLVAGSILNRSSSNWYSVSFITSVFTHISTTSLTQFRLRFELGDNNDGNADYLSFYSGNTVTPSNRPQLVIEYYVP